MDLRCWYWGFCWCWWCGALLMTPIAAGKLADVAEQEVRVPQGANITLLCSYNVTRHGRHVKTWYRQAQRGLVPLGKTDGWVAPGHKGRLSVSDLQHVGQMRVVMADVTDRDAGRYSCAIGRRVGVDFIRRIILQVSHAPVPDQDTNTANTTSKRLAVMPEHVGSDPATPQSTSGVWGLLRWLLFGLMASGTVLSSLIIGPRQGGHNGGLRSPEEWEDAVEETF